MMRRITIEAPANRADRREVEPSPDDDAPDCPICRDRGFIVEPASNRATTCACRDGALARARAQAARIPTRYQRLTRSSWELKYGPWAESGPLAPLADWPTSEAGDWLILLYGRYGRRKTGLAGALLQQAIARGAAGLFVDFNDWLDEMEAAFGTPEASRIYLAARDAEVLLVDDLGSVRTERRPGFSTWWKERAAALIRHREAWVLPTIVTTNLVGTGAEVPREASFPAGLATLDRSLVSRMDVRLAIEMVGPDYRRGEAARGGTA